MNARTLGGWIVAMIASAAAAPDAQAQYIYEWYDYVTMDRVTHAPDAGDPAFRSSNPPRTIRIWGARGADLISLEIQDTHLDPEKVIRMLTLVNAGQRDPNAFSSVRVRVRAVGYITYAWTYNPATGMWSPSTRILNYSGAVSGAAVQLAVRNPQRPSTDLGHADGGVVTIAVEETDGRFWGWVTILRNDGQYRRVYFLHYEIDVRGVRFVGITHVQFVEVLQHMIRNYVQVIFHGLDRLHDTMSSRFYHSRSSYVR